MDINSIIETIAKSKNISFEEAKLEFDRVWFNSNGVKPKYNIKDDYGKEN